MSPNYGDIICINPIRKQVFSGEEREILLLERHFLAAKSTFPLRWPCPGQHPKSGDFVHPSVIGAMWCLPHQACRMLAPQLSCSELLLAQLSSHNPQLFLESWVKYLPAQIRTLIHSWGLPACDLSGSQRFHLLNIRGFRVSAYESMQGWKHSDHSNVLYLTYIIFHINPRIRNLPSSKLSL